MTERGGPFSSESFNWMVKRVGEKAKLPFPVHAHMLRHSTGYKLASDGHDTRSIQDYLGHRDIRHTVRSTELSPKPFRDFWRDFQLSTNMRENRYCLSVCRGGALPVKEKIELESIYRTAPRCGAFPLCSRVRRSAFGGRCRVG